MTAHRLPAAAQPTRSPSSLERPIIVIFGTRTFGKVDCVPGLCSVATRFFPINFLPLIPPGSYMIFEGTDRGEPTGLSLKSLALAWGR
jgi:hypothetical protein